LWSGASRIYHRQMRSLLASLVAMSGALAACATAADSGQTGDVDAKMDPIDGPRTIDAPRVIDAPAIDAAIDAPISVTPDTCAQGQNITTGALAAGGITVMGNTTGYANDIQPANNCSGFIADGPDAIYVINVTAGQVITGTLSSTHDSSIELTSNCTLAATCLVGQDNGDPETFTHTATAAATLYVIVDSWDPGAFGAYTLNVRIQ